MKYEILYPEAFPVVECELERGESIKAESDAMIAMSPTIDIEGKMDGGILSSLARSFLSGESLFFQELVARRGRGKVLFGHSQIGGILDVELDGSYGLMIQKNGFLASTPGINIETETQNLSRGFLSGEGFFILNAKGRGTVFVSSYGVIHPINLEDREEVIIDNGHLVAWPDYMDYKMERASKGWISSFTSGEGLVCRFRGPGVVLIQTRNPDSFAQHIRSIVGAK
ncbi:MAG: TIGR00266 family protein [Selenomonadaceae bacterium]|nr:TIGR00266 family protein [Selenomonadaceae bacterium]MBQ3726100.1 TIGR00266 family protein [Selenomonadaceae bacterium]